MFYTPPQVAKLLMVRHSKVLTWIATGELRAMNVTEKPGGRPRWRISLDALKEFEERRSNPAPRPRRPRYSGPQIV